MRWVGNSNLRVGFDNSGFVKSLFSSEISDYNNIDKHSVHKIGLYVNNQISWLNDDDWSINISKNDNFTFKTKYYNHNIGIEIIINNFVLFKRSVFNRDIIIKNTNKEISKENVSLFFYQSFNIDVNNSPDVANFIPGLNTVLHSNASKYFAVGAKNENEDFSSFGVGQYGIPGFEGSYLDANDGELSNYEHQKGKTDSILKIDLDLNKDENHLSYWISVSDNLNDALAGHAIAKKSDKDSLLENNNQSLSSWINNAEKIANILPEKYQSNFKNSVKYVKSSILDSGALACFDDNNDSFEIDIKKSAISIWPLIRMGYTKEPLAFFDFCKDKIKKNRFILEQYNLSGSDKLSDFRFDESGKPPLNLETYAFIVFIFAQYYFSHPSKMLIHKYFDDLIKPSCKFIRSNIDTNSFMPIQSARDLNTSVYTVSVVYASLLAIAEVAESAKDTDEAVASRLAAEDIYKSAPSNIYSNENNFIKKYIDNDEAQPMLSIESFFGTFMFGLVDYGSDYFRNSAENIEKITQKTSLSNVENFWLAQYYIENDKKELAYKHTDKAIDNKKYFGLLEHTEFVATMLDIASGSQDSK